MSKKINIAIDGHSSCGKSTIAKSISQKFKISIDGNSVSGEICDLPIL